MSSSNPFLRLIAIRLGVVTVFLYAVRALSPDQAQTPASPRAAPAIYAAASDRCAPSKPIGKHDGEADALLRDMLLHD